MLNKTAIITGFTGMDGSHLASLLLEKNYKVYGMIRRQSNPNLDFIKEMNLEDVEIVNGDLCDSSSINDLVSKIKPDEFYNLAAMSHVGVSFGQPEHTGNVTGLGVLRCLEAIKTFSPSTKFYQASTSELFGNSPAPQNENTPLNPQSPYAAAKAYAHYMVDIYRKSYNIFASSSILMNHESWRRSKDFVTRKITSWIGENYHYIRDVNAEISQPLELGNLDAKRDWTWSPDMVRGMYMIMQYHKPEDFVLGTGISRSVRDFIEEAFKVVGINISWVGNGVNERGICDLTGRTLIIINPKFYRPCEVHFLQADYTKAKTLLGWEPEVDFEQLVYNMVNYDISKYGKANKCLSHL